MDYPGVWKNNGGGRGVGQGGWGGGGLKRGRHEAQAPSNQVKNYKQTVR